MPATPYYLITSCCDQSTTQGQFLIPGGGIVADGVYIFNGISFQEGTTGMWFYSGYCYQIEYLGTDSSSHPTAFNQADISISIANSCASSDCVSCELPDIPPSYSIYNCCDASVVVNLNVNITVCSAFDGTWVYEGEGYSTEAGFVFSPGDCYNFTRIPEGVYENAPDCTDFIISTRSCTEAQADGDCPTCDLGLQYLAFKPCCGGPIIYFRGNDATAYYGVREYLGTPVDGLENICYSIQIGNVGDGDIQDLPQYNALPFPPAYIEGVTFSTISIFSIDCDDFVDSCPSCFPPQCYTLYNCDGESFNTTVDFGNYVDEFILILDSQDNGSGPWLVKETTGPCENVINTVRFTSYAYTICPITCYTAIGEGEVTYIDSDLNVVTIYSPAQFCSYIYPTTSPGINISRGRDCVDDGNGFECQDYCFKLSSCEPGIEGITSNTQLLNQYYINNNIVTLNGYDGCWRVEDRYIGNCECGVPVTVLTSFKSCEECLPVVAYKFTNCENPALVLYSSQDYSQYVGLSIEEGCNKQCYSVSQIDYAPPVESLVQINRSFDGCVECLGKYYLLSDCSGLLPDVITSTNLENYLDQVIKIKNCDTCWQVSETRLETGEVSEIVSFDSVYLNGCQECLASIPALCTTIRNDDDRPVVFIYIDYQGNSNNITLQPGQTSEKVCAVSWTERSQSRGYIEYFGTCVDNQCPVPVLPARFVKPGYNTPTCDAEKWDKITCKSSEILYKMVLKARYGISNCCDALDDKWLIKKELIDLAALVDPNYTCTVSSCGCTTDTCGCGCSSTPKTCNSN